MDSIAVVGIGNNLLQDDGVGVHTLDYFRERYAAPAVRCIDAGTVGLALLDQLSNLNALIAIDAMRIGKPPGSVTVFEDTAMDKHLLQHHGSVHELGLSDLMDALRLAGDLPARRALIGIEPARVDWGTEPTPEVAAAVPGAAQLAHELIVQWRTAAVGMTA